MNDTELDDMLNKWEAPTPRAEMRERVKAGIVATPKREKRRFFAPVGWKGLFGCGCAGFPGSGAFRFTIARPPDAVYSEVGGHGICEGWFFAA